jgi:hypothetical protein
MPDLVEKIVAVHAALQSADLPHAFGGALALAWCTARARGTIDIDVNIFVPVTGFQQILDAMPKGVRVRKQDVTILKRDGQVRVRRQTLWNHLTLSLSDTFLPVTSPV